MPTANDVIAWAVEQSKKKTKSPVIARHKHSFPELSADEQKFLLEYKYLPKKSKTTGLELPSTLCSLWGAQYLVIDHEVVAPPEFDFLVSKLKTLPIYQHLSRIAVMSLDTGGYIMPHSDNPLTMQVSIPLIYDNGFHFVWQDWGEEILPVYSVNLININQTHAVWNTGARRIFINATVGKFESGKTLESLFDQTSDFADKN